MKSLGVPWIVRKAALKFAQNGMEVIRHTGSTINITSLNPKGSWHRVYDTSKTVVGKDVTGKACDITTRWDGSVLCSTLKGSAFGTCETWRYVKGSTMVVKTSFTIPQGDGTKEAMCYWWYERMEVLEQQLGSTKKMFHKHLAADQKRIDHATRKDTAFMRDILLDWERWESPADEFIVLEGVTRGSSSLRRQRNPQSRQRSPSTSRSCTPKNMSASPSSSTLNKIPDTAQKNDEISTILSSHKHHLPVHPIKRAASPGLVNDGRHPGMTRRFGSNDNLSDIANIPPHYRSASSESMSSMQARKIRDQINKQMNVTESHMSHKLNEFVETYGITSVIPVRTPHDTAEPQLLGMSPEQAEETTAKLRELETDMLLRRQEQESSLTCCGLVISLEKDSLPDHLRVWEMTLF